VFHLRPVKHKGVVLDVIGLSLHKQVPPCVIAEAHDDRVPYVVLVYVSLSLIVVIDLHGSKAEGDYLMTEGPYRLLEFGELGVEARGVHHMRMDTVIHTTQRHTVPYTAVVATIRYRDMSLSQQFLDALDLGAGG